MTNLGRCPKCSHDLEEHDERGTCHGDVFEGERPMPGMCSCPGYISHATKEKCKPKDIISESMKIYNKRIKRVLKRRNDTATKEK